MSELKGNLVSVKVSASLVDAMKDMQHARRKAGFPEPTYAELLAEAWGKLAQTVPQTEPTKVGPVLSVEHLQIPTVDPLTQDVLVPILVNHKDITWLSILSKLLNCSFPAFSIAIKENLRTFLFGLISAEQVKAGALSDEIRSTPDAEAGDSLARGIAELGKLLEATGRGLEANPQAPKIVQRKTR